VMMVREPSASSPYVRLKAEDWVLLG